MTKTPAVRDLLNFSISHSLSVEALLKELLNKKINFYFLTQLIITYLNSSTH